MTPFRANVRPGAPRLSPSSPDISGERVHHARLNTHREPLYRRCSRALGAVRRLNSQESTFNDAEAHLPPRLSSSDENHREAQASRS
jgi:hypothetical protein